MFYDPLSKLEIKSGGNLPHWHQDGKVQFVTFRLADSLPTNVIGELTIQIEDFNKIHPQPWDFITKREYWRIIGAMEERLLDKGHGSCLLERVEIRKVITEAIMFGDGVGYNVIAYVVMPNHVHILVQLLEQHTLSQILHSIKGFSASKINKIINRRGQFWMKESFDRIVRSSAHLARCINYIKENPRNLASDRFDLYINPAYR